MSTASLEGLPHVARLMARLCEIPSPSGQEQQVARAVKAELAKLGADVVEDDAVDRIPAGCNNILARFAPTVEGGVPIMFADEVIGAIGISGGSEDQDTECARAGIAAIEALLAGESQAFGNERGLADD